MKIDANPIEMAAMAAFHEGDIEQGRKLQDQFVDELKASLKTEDHCSCKEACKFHGKCLECVAIHRAHQDHLPNCFRPMVNARLRMMSQLTEHTALKDQSED